SLLLSLSCQKCEEALSSPLPHTAFTASSVFTSGYAPGYAKLNRRGGAGGWSPQDSDSYPWLQVDLGNRRQVVAVATQGRYSSSDWTTRYRLLYSDTGRNWKPYHQDGNIWAFSGNSNTESVVRHDLAKGIMGRFLRFVPLDWSGEGRIGLRIEVYGCSYCDYISPFSLSLPCIHTHIHTHSNLFYIQFKTSSSVFYIAINGGFQSDFSSILDSQFIMMWFMFVCVRVCVCVCVCVCVRVYVCFPLLSSSGSVLNDGQWHTVRLVAKENSVLLTIDGDEASAIRTTTPITIRTGGTYHLGGYFLPTLAPPTQKSFQGCMQAILLDDQPADMHAVEKGMVGAFENVSLDMCAIIDRCMPNHCEHGGRCKQTWDRFSCTCDGTGYTGATCHTSVFEQSCEAYKHLGRSSDTYWIDPDGSGPLGPFKVNCNMTEDKVWTTVVNNLPAQTSVTGSSRERRTVLQLNYSASMEQVTAITTSAEHCEQHVSYGCLLSRLLNTPDGTPYTWWVGRSSEKHFYWGGSGPGIQKCSCGIDRNCTDPKYDCNCDADHKQWREDSGLLVYKDHLPVSQVAVGDTNRLGSEAKLTVGPLRCQGDRNYWNAASFTTPSSYLHFSTFQGETSADISFYFKTSAPYGVFLENLGNTDFIRLELKSPTVISFSFDVGNGPVELAVHSATPLNDDQWHRVMAERNVKEAVLQLDLNYREARPAPPQGHTRLELFSQLYVGAAGGQRGFLGCIRSLRMNGVTLDLEERAKVTPGVKPGCQGHCTSYGMYCRNGGKCVEKYNGYSCDCTATAYDGPFCTKDVGGFFEAGTLVRYDFLSESANQDTRFVAQPSTPQEVNLTGEEVAFSFSTSNTPAILLYASSKTQDYLALVLRQNGTLQVRYNLGGLKEPFTIDVDQRNLANGQPHTINMSRSNRTITIQLDHYPPVSYSLPEASDTQFNLVKTLFLGKVFETGVIDPALIERYNTPGFIGCLSRVQFNGVTPLKTALRNLSVPVSYQGKLVESNCGASPLTIPPMSAATDPWRLDSGAEFPFNEERVIPDGVNRNSAIIGGIIAVVIFTILCTLAFLIRYMFRHKGSYHTNESKAAEPASGESADTTIIGTDPNPETIDESKKEWFI
uniref:Contactin associated protein 2 n=1 Tax=Oncorhynchus kisutch TaxID=8019 RepID=A0A8C7N8X4_ONCKI